MPSTKRKRGSAATPARGVRERILDAALDVLQEAGLRQLTQVRVAEHAGVRQSHLTYYFPTRQDLLEGVTAHFVERAHHSMEGHEAEDPEALLAHFAAEVIGLEHTRMFLGVIVEADTDPALREMVVDATRQIETVLARSLEGTNARERARVILAATWGLALYQFVTRPSGRASIIRPYLAWLANVAESPDGTRS